MDKVPKIFFSDLVLAPITLKHLDAYFEICSDHEVMKGYGLLPHREKQETKIAIEFLEEGFKTRELIRWGIFTKDEKDLMGDAGYWRFVKTRFRAELGAKLAKQYWNKGYMTQVLSFVIQFGFDYLALHSVEGNIVPENVGSIRMVEKLGFQREGHLKEHSYNPFTKEFEDTYLYSLLKQNWKRLPYQVEF